MNAQSPSTALTNVEPAHPKVAAMSAGAVMAIVPQTFDDVYRFAQVLSRSGLVPYGMDTAEKVSVAILTGLEIGVKPMQAVQGIAVINGAPRIWGDLALAVVRGSGLLEKFSETLVGSPPSNWPNPTAAERVYKAVCVVKRKGEDEVVKEYSIDDAIVAKLWNKSGPKGPTPWVTNPKRMLAMRARAFALRDAFTDILKGMPIAEEMIGDEVDDASYRPSSNEPPPPPADLVEDAVIVSETAAAGPSPAEAQAADASPGSSPVEGASAADPEEPGINPDDEIANLIDKLAYAQDEATVEEWYAETDIEAALAEFTGYVEKARQVKALQVDRVRGIAARAAKAEPQAAAQAEAAAPPPPPALADEEEQSEAPPPPPADDAGFYVDGWQALTTQAQYAEYAKRLAAYADKISDAAMIEKFFNDSAKMRSALFPIATAKAERTVIVDGLNATMSAINARAQAGG